MFPSLRIPANKRIMPASGKKLLVHLTLVCLVIATTNAKALTTKREVEKRNYFENILENLNSLKNVPIVGDAIKPLITNIYNTVKGMDKWSDGSVSKLVNSIFPCQLNNTVLTCTGSLDRNSLHTLIKKILRTLPIGTSIMPMLELATDMAV